MNNFLFIIIEGIIIFAMVWAFNYFFFVKKMRKFKKDDMPLELIYLANIYDIDPTKVDYHKFQITYCFINAFIITVDCLLVIYLIKTMFMRIIVGIVLVILLIILCYGLLGKHYQKMQGRNIRKKSEE